MKRFNLFIILLALVQVAGAQKNQYTERLDSIVMSDSGNPSIKFWKHELGYNTKGQVEQVLYSRWKEGGWSLRTKDAYFYDEQGRDTLIAVFRWKKGQWDLWYKDYYTYDNRGERVPERSEVYDNGKMFREIRYDYVYDEQGKQVSSCQYLREIGTMMPEGWRIEKTVQEEYDAKGNHIKELYEYPTGQTTKKGEITMCYDEEGRLTAEIDSTYEVQEGGRVWRRQEYSYNVQQLSVMKDIWGTNTSYMSLDECLFDPQGNLSQELHYAERDGELHLLGSESYFYDLTKEGSSIMGYDLLPDILGKGEDHIHHKLMTTTGHWFKEYLMDNSEDARRETRLYYTLF